MQLLKIFFHFVEIYFIGPSSHTIHSQSYQHNLAPHLRKLVRALGDSRNRATMKMAVLVILVEEGVLTMDSS
jgi:hypothetical protein